MVKIRTNSAPTASRFPPESKNPELILLAVEDITEHKQAEAVVQTSEVRYRRLFESARDGILILDADPSEDVAVLGDPSHVRTIIKDGQPVDLAS